MTERPDSIRQLAERLERDVKSVYDDLQVLTEYDIVHFQQAGRAKRPFIPYDSIEIGLETSFASEPTITRSRASARRPLWSLSANNRAGSGMRAVTAPPPLLGT